MSNRLEIVLLTLLALVLWDIAKTIYLKRRTRKIVEDQRQALTRLAEALKDAIASAKEAKRDE